jgi:phage portal protein BeeE
MSQALALLDQWGYSKEQGDPRPPAEILRMADGYRWEIPDAYSHEKQAKLYALNTWIRTAIDHTAALGAGAQYSVAKLVDEPGGADDEDIPNHDFERLLRRPNPMQSGREFLRDELSWFKATGNLYLFKNAAGEGATPDELWIIPSTMIVPVPDGNSYIRGYLFTPPGSEAIPLERWRVMHLKTWNPYNPFVGLSQVQTLALAALADIAQEKFNLEFFDKNAGRFPGILGFKHMIAEPEWKEMIRKRDAEWGGTNRSPLMMLRGVGDTIQYLPAAASQKEMEFLESQGFTRAKTYGLLAPGLDSVLAINATQANSDAGKATLMELGVWPMLDQLGQKYEAEILPLYGDNLVGAFDEMRPSKLAMNIAEVETEAKFFTVNEIRERRYKAEPMYLDESQVAALEEDMAQAEENNATALEQAQAAQPPKPAKKPAFGKADTLGTVMDKDGKPRKLDPRGFMLVGQIGPATPLPGDASQPPAPPPMPPVAPPVADGPDKEAPVKAELEAWERFALKHAGGAKREFEPHAVPLLQAVSIKAALKGESDPAAIREVFADIRAGRDPQLSRLTRVIKEASDKL